jgi:glycosyltransferase involved in cell wall biosynthesis
MTGKTKMCVVTTVAATLHAFLLEQLLFLSDNGFDITIVCDHDDELLHNCPEKLKYEPVAMTRNANITSTIMGMIKLYKIIRGKRFDIVQYVTPKAAFTAAIVSWLARIPVRLYCQWGIRYVSMTGMTRWFFKRIEKITCSCSTHISPDSRGNLEFSVSEGLYTAENASVVHYGSANGVNLNRFNFRERDSWRNEGRGNFGLDADSFVFGWVGRVTRDKGVKELISAFLDVLKHAPSNTHLLMVGEMEKNHGLENEIINQIESHPRIHYVGPQRNIEKFYAAIDVLVVPSYREGFGMVAIEAQAMGVPVIVSDIPGPREAIVDGKTGILVPVRQIETIVAGMIKIMENNDLRKSMGEEAMYFVYSHFEQNTFWSKVLEHRKLLVSNRA